MRTRVLERVDQVNHLLRRPPAVHHVGHVKGQEQLKVGRLGRRERLVQLRQRPRVLRADVEREAVDSHGLGVVDVLLPLREGLAVGEADLCVC